MLGTLGNFAFAFVPEHSSFFQQLHAHFFALPMLSSLNSLLTENATRATLPRAWHLLPTCAFCTCVTAAVQAWRCGQQRAAGVF